MIPDYKLARFYGLNTNIKDLKTLKPGITPDALNWITGGEEGDHIELRRGQALLGATRNEDVGGKVTGIGVGIRYDGNEVPFYSHGRKIKYYDETTADTIEVGTDLLPVGASGEDVWFKAYQSLAGSMVYLGSPNSSVYKIPVANPGSAVDQAVSNYRWGVFHIGQNRSFNGQRNGTVGGNNDKTGLYLSYIDKAQLSSYTLVSGEAYGTGDGATLTFANTLDAISAPKTAMYVSVTDGVETFIDDRNGNMVGNAGGTGGDGLTTDDAGGGGGGAAGPNAAGGVGADASATVGGGGGGANNGASGNGGQPTAGTGASGGGNGGAGGSAANGSVGVFGSAGGGGGGGGDNGFSGGDAGFPGGGGGGGEIINSNFGFGGDGKGGLCNIAYTLPSATRRIIIGN